MYRAAMLGPSAALAVALALLAAGCGAEPAAALRPAGSGLSSGPIYVEDDGLDDDDDDDDDDAVDDGPPLPPEVVTRVRRSFHRLEAAGALPEARWELARAPPPDRYAHVPLASDFARGIYDGYAYEALVAVDEDGTISRRFYVLRVGGIAGWQFLAGPFALSDHVPTTELTAEHAEQTVAIARGDRIAVELRGVPAAGARWYAEAGPLGRPVQVPCPRRDAVRIVFAPAPDALQPGGVYRIRLRCRRPGVAAAERQFVAYVQVRP